MVMAKTDLDKMDNVLNTLLVITLMVPHSHTNFLHLFVEI